MFAEAHLKRWWARRLSDDQRAQLKEAAEKTMLDPAAVALLFNTECPVGPIGTRWETQPDWDWSWPHNVRDFVAAQ